MSYETPRYAYQGWACIKCGEYAMPSKPLLKCSKCKGVSYCGEVCQRADYRGHKRFCRAWAAVRKREPPAPKTGALLQESIERRIVWTVKAIGTLLGHPLDGFQQRLVILEPRCAVCFRTDHDLREKPDFPGQQLLTCDECFSIYACSEMHQEMVQKTHASEPYEPDGQLTRCRMHRLAAIDDEEDSRYCLAAGRPIWFPDRKLMKPIPLTMFPPRDAWTKWLSLPETEWPNDAVTLLSLRTVSACLTYPMTIMYGVELFDTPECHMLMEKRPSSSVLPVMRDPLRSRSQLEIHIIGLHASQIAAKHAIVFEELLHLLPGCKKLILRFIAPDIEKYGCLLSEVPFDFDDLCYGCEACRRSGTILVQSFHSYTYHEWVQERRCENGSTATLMSPDLAVCFNTSILEDPCDKSLWAPTVSLLLDMGVPTLISSVTQKDIITNSILVEELGGLIVVNLRRNPWRDEQAIPEICGNDEFYFFNGYIFGFCGRSMKQV